MAKKPPKTRGQLARAYASGRNYSLADPAVLAGEVRTAITSRHVGSLAAAARAAGIPRGTLRRLAAGDQTSIRHETVERLKTFFPRDRWLTVERAIVTQEATLRLQRYDDWMEATRASLRDGALRPAVGSLERFGSPNREFAQLLRRLGTEFPSLWAPLRKALKHHSKPRAALAFERVIGPLLDYHDSAGIERHSTDLSKKDLATFIKAGVKREVLMLHRDPDIKRAQSRDLPAISRPPSLRRKLAGTWNEP